MKSIEKLKEFTSYSNFTFYIFHRLLGVVYIVASGPLFFQVTQLIGEDGLLPASKLLRLSYEDQGIFLSFMQFPSLFHFFPFDITLIILTAICTLSGLMLIINRITFPAALSGWFSFLSITSIGGDFFVIIIDLFLSEVGFLAIFSTYYLSKYNALPNIIVYAFKILNFKLWFCMGVNKFYMPFDVWKELTFFNYFFHGQPMPTPLAPVFNQAPEIFKKAAILGLFVAEIIIPFFIFGGKQLRRVAFITFFITSIIIQINGNYGYFNLLSVVLLFTILKDTDFPFYKKQFIEHFPPKDLSIGFTTKFILFSHILFQLILCIYIFNPRQHSAQNHFNHIFNNIQTENKLTNTILYPFKWVEYWRICNPYGVFKGIPYYHGEIRLSGSNDGENWKIYEFKHVPSAHTDYLGFYAPYYPRLDHLMFYETLAAQNYRWNLLNPYYNEENSWICRFVEKLLSNDDEGINRLIKKNPFYRKNPPEFIRAEVFRLEFSDEKQKNWSEKAMGITKIFSKENPCSGRIISLEEALKTTYSKEE